MRSTLVSQNATFFFNWREAACPCLAELVITILKFLIAAELTHACSMVQDMRHAACTHKNNTVSLDSLLEWGFLNALDYATSKLLLASMNIISMLCILQNSLLMVECFICHAG